MIFNMTGGGGSAAGLNFKVVGGTTQPSNPSENTIWVNTDKEITGWIFSAKNPFIGEIVESAGVLSGTVGTSVLNQTGYSFRKVNDGKAVMAFFNSDSSVGVMLVSRDRDACKISKVPKITTIDTTTTIEAENNFIYDGDTYYYAYILFNKTMYYILDAEPIDCTSYTVLANALAPTYNIDNKVWIKSGEISTVSFNALKKNGIMIYPLSAKQYISGAWTTVTAMTYQGEQWVDWILYLYNQGVKNVDWTASGDYYTDGETYLLAGRTSSAGAYTGTWTSGLFDATNLNTVEVYVDKYNRGGPESFGKILILDEAGDTLVTKSYSASQTAIWESLDISTITSKCKVRVTSGHTRTSGQTAYIQFSIVRCS